MKCFNFCYLASLSSVSLSSSDDKENLNSNIKPINIDINPTPVENAKIVKQINANEEKPIVKENEVIINGICFHMLSLSSLKLHFFLIPDRVQIFKRF